MGPHHPIPIVRALSLIAITMAFASCGSVAADNNPWSSSWPFFSDGCYAWPLGSRPAFGCDWRSTVADSPPTTNCAWQSRTHAPHHPPDRRCRLPLDPPADKGGCGLPHKDPPSPAERACPIIICERCQADDQRPSDLAKCPDAATWEERFQYATDRVKLEDYDKANAILVPALRDCDAGVRRRALDILLQIRLLGTAKPEQVAPVGPPGAAYLLWSTLQIPPIIVKCQGMAPWEERFQYSAGFIKSEDYDKAVPILEGALKDCDSEVRHRALGMLEQINRTKASRNWIEKAWRYLKANLNDEGAIVFKSLLLVALTLLLLFALRLLALVWNRRTISPQPLTVSSGGGFDGEHFVAIAQQLYFEMQSAFRVDAVLPALSAAAPRMMTDAANTEAADALGALAPTEEVGKLAGLFLAIFKRPRYTCSGSVHISGRSTHMIIWLKRGRKLVRIWERSSQAMRLTEDIKDLTFLGLQTAWEDMRGRWI